MVSMSVCSVYMKQREYIIQGRQKVEPIGEEDLDLLQFNAHGRGQIFDERQSPQVQIPASSFNKYTAIGICFSMIAVSSVTENDSVLSSPQYRAVEFSETWIFS